MLEMKVKLVYIAGPFRAKSEPRVWNVERNIRRAEELGYIVMQMGAYPVIPHANTRYSDGLNDHLALAGSMRLMIQCDAICMVNNWEESSGSIAEKHEAESLGMPVFYEDKLEDLELWLSCDEKGD